MNKIIDENHWLVGCIKFRSVEEMLWPFTFSSDKHLSSMVPPQRCCAEETSAAILPCAQAVNRAIALSKWTADVDRDGSCLLLWPLSGLVTFSAGVWAVDDSCFHRINITLLPGLFSLFASTRIIYMMRKNANSSSTTTFVLAGTFFRKTELMFVVGCSHFRASKCCSEQIRERERLHV